MIKANRFRPPIQHRSLRTRVRPPRRPLRYPEQQQHEERKPAQLPPHGVSSRTETAKPSDLLEKVPGLVEHAYRWETAGPSGEQLKLAQDFFAKFPAKHLWSEAKFKKIEVGRAPEVAFLGRSNVGKSTLLNALLNHKGLAYTSSKPGRTKLLSAFAINQGKILLLDMPGYGHASREEWGTQVMKYITSRKQFRRAFVLIDAKHGPKSSDLMLLERLGREGVSYQIILSKIDKLSPFNGDLQRAFLDTKYLMETGLGGVSGLGEVLGVAGDPAKKGPKIGINDLRWSIMVACGLGGVK